MSERHESDIKVTSKRHQRDIKATSKQHTRDMQATYKRHQSGIRTTSTRHQSDIKAVSKRHQRGAQPDGNHHHKFSLRRTAVLLVYRRSLRIMCLQDECRIQLFCMTDQIVKSTLHILVYSTGRAHHDQCTLGFCVCEARCPPPDPIFRRLASAVDPHAP